MDDPRPDLPDERLEALFAAELAAAERDYRRQPTVRRRVRTAPAASVAVLAALTITVAAFIRLGTPSGPPLGSSDTSPPSQPAPVVTPGADARIPVPTAKPRPSGGLCAAANASGTLAADPRWGVALRGGSNVREVIWPHGFSAADDHFGRALLDPGGRVVARVGDYVWIGGGGVPGRGDAFGACHLPPVVNVRVAAVLVPNAAPLAGGSECLTAHLGGELVAHDEWGVAVRSGEQIRKVLWPHGFFARDDERGRALINDRGRIVGYVGDPGGASGGGDPFRACPGTVSFVGPARIAVPTGEPVAPDAPCDAAQTAGELVAHEAWGVAMLQGDRVVRVIWPNGYSARDDPRGRALVDEEDAILGYVGDNVNMGGGYGLAGDTWFACPSSIAMSPGD
jgi:hypothetical protein